MSIAVQEPSKRSLEMLLCQHGGKIIQPSLRKAEGLLSLRYALTWLLNQDKHSQTSKQGCIMHLPSALVPTRIQLYPTAQPPASHFPQKTAKLCHRRQDCGREEQDQSCKETRTAMVHRSPARSWPQVRAGGPSLSCWGSATSQLFLIKQQLAPPWLVLLFLCSEVCSGLHASSSPLGWSWWRRRWVGLVPCWWGGKDDGLGVWGAGEGRGEQPELEGDREASTVAGRLVVYVQQWFSPLSSGERRWGSGVCWYVPYLKY